MIQSEISIPEPIDNLGKLREWLECHKILPDETEIQVYGNQHGDECPQIAMAHRHWDKNENGAWFVRNDDGTEKQVDQEFIIIREFDPRR